MIELADGIFIAPEHVVAVKKIDDGQCALFFIGQSAVDGGFLLPYSAEEVSEAINDALFGEEEIDEDDQEEDE